MDEKDRQMFQYLVSGIIINDPNGPRRWADWIDDTTPRRAEATAKAMVAQQVVEGRRGILLVANIFQLDANGLIAACDKYAVYADDPDRPDGYAPAGGWKPPKGFEGFVR